MKNKQSKANATSLQQLYPTPLSDLLSARLISSSVVLLRLLLPLKIFKRNLSILVCRCRTTRQWCRQFRWHDFSQKNSWKSTWLRSIILHLTAALPPKNFSFNFYHCCRKNMPDLKLCHRLNTTLKRAHTYESTFPLVNWACIDLICISI